MKRIKFFFILAVVLGGIYFAVGQIGMLSGDEQSGIPFRTEVVSRGTISDTISATGAISPEEVVTIGTQVSGKITQVYVKMNDEVKAGQVLAEIDPAIQMTRLRQSKASLETSQNAYVLAQRDYERTKSLAEKDFVAKVELDRSYQSLISSKNSLLNSQIQVEQDEVNLSYTKVTSPIDGVIIAQEIKNGQTVASSFSSPNLFRIAKDLTVMSIDMNVPESDISKINVGKEVEFAVDAFKDRKFMGRVDSIVLNPNIVSGVVTYTVIVLLENKDRALLPGMTANITITLSEKVDIVRIPAAALRFIPPRVDINPIKKLLMPGKRRENPVNASPEQEKKEDERSIFLWRNNDIEEVYVKTGATDDLYVEVTNDAVKVGDLVITGNVLKAE